MIDQLVVWLRGVPEPLIVFVIAALPVVELRLAIPYGIFTLSLPVMSVIVFAVLGNLVPVLPLLYFLAPLSARLRRLRVWARFFDWLFARTRRRAGVIERYELWGLMIFVSLPLPMTGAWTGAVAASLFNLDKKRSFAAISAGIFIAAGIVTLLTLGTKGMVQHVP